MGGGDGAAPDLAPCLSPRPLPEPPLQARQGVRGGRQQLAHVRVPGPLQLPGHLRSLREGEGRGWVTGRDPAGTPLAPELFFALGNKLNSSFGGTAGAHVPLTHHLPVPRRSAALTTRPTTPPAISSPPSAPWREPRRGTSCTWTTLGPANVSGAVPFGEHGSPCPRAEV